MLVYLLLVGQFGSFLDPLLILITVPFGLIGVMTTLWVTQTTLNVQSFIGIIFMVGIAVSNGILLVEFSNRLHRQGHPASEAAIRAATIRLRPILMTSMATVLGLIPMAIGIGHGAEANVPLARAVLGGLAVSMVMTLTALPLLYGFLKRDRRVQADATSVPALVGTTVVLCLVLAGSGTARASEDAPHIPVRSLEEVTAIALQHHPELRAAHAQVDEQAANVWATFSPLLPRANLVGIDSHGLGGSSGATGISGVVNSPFRKHPSAGVDAAWTLFDGSTLFKGLAARTHLKGARQRLASSEASLRLAVAEAYVRCAGTQALETVLLRRLEDQESLVQELEPYVKSGLRSPVELNLSRATLEGIRARSTMAHADAEAAFAAVLEAMGVGDESPFRCEVEAPPQEQPGAVEELVHTAWSKRPEVAEAEATAQAAHQEWLAAQWGHMPRLVAVGSAGYIDKTRLVERTEYSIGAGVVMPVFDGFRVEAEQAKAKARETAARARLEEMRQRVSREVRSAYAQFLGAVNALPMLQHQLDFAEEAYHLARKRYAEKTGSFADLRDAQNAFDAISEQHITVLGQFELAYQRLIIVSGQVNPSP